MHLPNTNLIACWRSGVIINATTDLRPLLNKANANGALSSSTNQGVALPLSDRILLEFDDLQFTLTVTAFVPLVTYEPNQLSSAQPSNLLSCVMLLGI